MRKPKTPVESWKKLLAKAREGLGGQASVDHSLFVENFLDHYGSSVLAVLVDSVMDSSLEFLVLVEDYDAIYDSTSQVLLNGVLPPNTYKFSIVKKGQAMECQVHVASLRRLEWECRGHAWDFGLVGRIGCGMHLVYEKNKAVSRRLVNSVANASMLLARMAVDKCGVVFDERDYLEEAMNNVSSGRSPSQMVGDLGHVRYDFEEMALICLSYLAQVDPDLRRGEGRLWSWGLNPVRRGQRVLYRRIFALVASFRGVLLHSKRWLLQKQSGPLEVFRRVS